MKKLSALIALLLGLLPTTPAMADSTEAGQKQTLTGNVALTGSLTATNLNPVFTEFSGSTYSYFANSVISPANPTNPNSFTIHTNLMLKSSILIQTTPPITFASLQITGFSIECTPYNPAFLAFPGYPYGIDTNGISGGTFTFYEFKPTGAVVTIGTLTLPSSPFGGPYSNIADNRLGAPYTPTSGSLIGAAITGNDLTHNQSYAMCQVSALLQ